MSAVVKRKDTKWKKFVPIYAIAFALLAILPSVLVDLYYVQQTTAFETGKVASLVGLCIVTDIVIWGLAATVIVIVTVLILLLIRLAHFIKDRS